MFWKNKEWMFDLERRTAKLEADIVNMKTKMERLLDRHEMLAGKVMALRDHLGVAFTEGVRTIGGKKHEPQP